MMKKLFILLAACLLVSCSKSPFQLEKTTKIKLSGEKIANRSKRQINIRI